MKTLSIRWRLFFGALFLSVLASTIGIFAIRGNTAVADTFLGEGRFESIAMAATEASSYAKRAEGHMMLYLTLGDKTDRDKFYERTTSLNEQIDIMDANIKDRHARNMLNGIKATSDTLLSKGISLLADYDRSINSTGAFDFKDNEAAIRQLHEIASTIRQQALELTTYEIKLETSTKAVALNRLDIVNSNLIIIIAVAFAFSLLVAYIVSVSIWRPLRRLREAVKKVGKGDLNTEINVTAKDEIGELAIAFNEMTGQLRQRLEERNRADEALSSSEAKFRIIFNEAHDGILLVDSETGDIVDCNPEAEKQTGRARSELGKIKVWELSPPELIEDKRKLFLSFQNQQEITSSETGYLRPDGTICPVEFLSKALEIRDKKYVLILTHDLTERRTMQERLIAQDRLVSIGQLVSGVAHELNNPLTSVIGFSELLLRDDLPDRVKADIQIICSEANRCAAIIKNLLIFARQQAQEKQLIDVNGPVMAVLQLREHQQSVNNIKIENYLTQGLPQVLASSAQLQQVFFNIVINAEQAILAVHNKGVISISSECKNSHVRVKVTDDGPGISKEHLGRLFSPFFTTKEPGSGTGLGLSISQGIVGEHGGKMWAESNPGKGATFIVELPVFKGNC